MGMADIVPGVSGGTVAFITGVYEKLLQSISRVDKTFVSHLLSMRIAEASTYINLKFLVPLGIGIVSAILLMSRLMHYLMNAHAVLTWSLFFGLIVSSIFYLKNQISAPYQLKSLAFLGLGTAIGAGIVSLVPVTTPHNFLTVFFAGFIAICAMVLPGISGSFILLILGKYTFVTGLLKNPFASDNFLYIFTFVVGCAGGLLSFSKLIHWLLSKYHDLMICILTGFMIGSLKKIWPWKQVLEQKEIGGKTVVISEANILPPDLSPETLGALVFMLVGFMTVIGIERISKSKTT